jgi:hypothetical protein
VASRGDRTEQLRAIWAETPWDDVATFIGPNPDKFRATWDKQREMILSKGSGIAWSFCWPFLFLSFVWFFYRKQWLMGVVLIVVPLIFAFFLPSVTGAFGGIGIALAAMAKSAYLQDAMAKIAKIRVSIQDDAGRQTALAAAGGVSWPAALISGGVLAASLAAVVLTMVR